MLYEMEELKTKIKYLNYLKRNQFALPSSRYAVAYETVGSLNSRIF